MANTAITTGIVSRAVCKMIDNLWLDRIEEGPMTHWFDFKPTPEQLMLPCAEFEALIFPEVADLVKRCKETKGRFRLVVLPQGIIGDIVKLGGICVGVVSMNSESGPGFRIGVCYR